jgi:putative endonuclease
MTSAGIAAAARRRSLGQRGERAAAELLESLGWKVIGAGFLARRGEIDLVAERAGRLVLVEVKTRSSDRFGTPLQAVTLRKRRALSAAAAEYRALAGWHGPIEFAIVAVTVAAGGGALTAELIEDAF